MTVQPDGHHEKGMPEYHLCLHEFLFFHSECKPTVTSDIPYQESLAMRGG